MNVDFMIEVFFVLIRGIPMTLKLVSISMLAGSSLGMILALLANARSGLVRSVVQGYVFTFRSTPLLVQVFIIYYGLGQFRPELQTFGVWWVFRDPFYCAVIAFALNTAAYISVIVRGGIRSVSVGQIEAALACGMSSFLLFRRIVLPIAFRNALPAYGNEIVLMIKATSLASIITIMEVTGIAARLIAETYRPVEIFIVAGGIYLVINALMLVLLRTLEWRLTPHLRMAR